jgi:hypothetical protein
LKIKIQSSPIFLEELKIFDFELVNIHDNSSSGYFIHPSIQWTSGINKKENERKKNTHPVKSQMRLHNSTRCHKRKFLESCTSSKQAVKGEEEKF